MTGNVLKEIEENIKDYEEQGIEQIPLSLVKYWISVLGKENKQLKKRLSEREKMLDVRDKIIANVMKAVNGDVE